MTKDKISWWWLMLPMIASAWVRDLWAPDEPRYAEVAREIFERGDFLVMHLCGDLYPDKPPLLFWTSGLFGWLSGWSEFWMRMPSLLATFGAAWLITLIARRWWGEIEAGWAAALYLSMAMVVELGGRLQIDPMLTFFCLFAIYALTTPEQDARRRTWWLLVGGLAMGIGALAKGPLVHVNVGLVLIAWRLAGIRSEGARVRAWVWPAVIVLSILPVMVWAVAAALVDHRLFEALFYDQHVGRITKGDRHPGAWYKHLLGMPPLLLPWTFLVLSAFPRLWAEFRRRREADADLGLVRSALWLAVLFVFFSAIPPKRDLYLLPAYPAIALFSARVLTDAFRRQRLSAWVPWVTGVLLGVVSLGLLSVGFVKQDLLDGLAWRGGLLGIILGAGAVSSLVMYRRHNLRSWAVSILLSWTLFTTVLAAVIFLPMNELKSGRSLAAELNDLPLSPTEIPCIRVRPEAYRFYGRLPAVYADELRSYRLRDGENFVGMILERRWQDIPEDEKATMRVLMRRSVGSKDIVVLGSAESKVYE